MPATQRSRLNWLDTLVLVAASVVLLAAIFVIVRVAALEGRVENTTHEVQLNRVLGCGNQLRTTGTTVPVCRGLDLDQGP